MELAQSALTDARAAGADAADVLIVSRKEVTVHWRLRARERLERSEERQLGLRVMKGNRQAVVATGDFDRILLRELAERALAMACAAPEDEGVGLAGSEEMATGIDPQSLDLEDPDPVEIEKLSDRAALLESSALGVRGVTNSEGASAGYGVSEIVLAASNGFTGSYRTTSHGHAVSVLSGEGVAMESDYDYQSAHFYEDLEDLAMMGMRVGKMACARVGARPAKTGRYSVVFDPRVGGRLVGAFLGAINGEAILRGASFLANKMGECIFPRNVSIFDDPLCRRGLASLPFDGEGVAVAPRFLVRNGVLNSWLLDLRSARRLGLPPGGHGRRGTGSAPSPGSSNVRLTPGNLSPATLMIDIKEGFYVTDLMGFGVNTVTGDFSQGARGFWIIGGEKAFPVNEATIAGNLLDMFRVLRPANDLSLKRVINTPTIRIDEMMVAGG